MRRSQSKARKDTINARILHSFAAISQRSVLFLRILLVLVKQKRNILFETKMSEESVAQEIIIFKFTGNIILFIFFFISGFRIFKDLQVCKFMYLNILEYIIIILTDIYCTVVSSNCYIFVQNRLFSRVLRENSSVVLVVLYDLIEHFRTTASQCREVSKWLAEKRKRPGCRAN